MTQGPRIARVEIGAITPEMLPPAELAGVSPRASPKRIREYCAGRAAARAALRARVADRVDDLVVIADPEGPTGGCPRVWAKDGPHADLHVSITHAGRHALAVADDRPIGIDLVLRDEPWPPAFIEEVFLVDELAAWRHAADELDEHARLSLAFAAKEAAVKWSTTGLRLPLRSFAVLPVGRLQPIEVASPAFVTPSAPGLATLRGPRPAELELFALRAFDGVVAILRELPR
jgi:4'-phosphopantetheinyl transferase EntD